jgi:transcriptional regulator with XRE-family HTH domain
VSMSGESGNAHTGIEIGKSLRLAREKRGLSLQQVEEATKIRTRYLRDLENENFDVLPAVYMLGSLKTYAEHLGLDGAAMTGELKRRQASMQPEQDQPREVSPSREPQAFVAFLGRLVGISGTVEDKAGTTAHVRKPGLYVSLGVVLLFVLATYLESTMRGEDRASVSVVQEPTLTQLPSGIALVGNVEDERQADDVSKESQPEKQTESPPLDTGDDEGTTVERGEPEEYATQTAQISSSVTASASASASAPAGASASASPALIGSSTGSASTPETATPQPTRVRPEPAAREQPKDARRAIAAAPTDGPSASVPGGRDPSPGFQRNQAEPVDSTLPDNSSSTKVKISTKVKKTEYSTW